MATRPDHGVLGTIASIESITRVNRTTCFGREGRPPPRIAAAEIRIASAVTAYNSVRSRLRSLRCKVPDTAENAEERLGGTTVESFVAAARSPEASSCARDTMVSAMV